MLGAEVCPVEMLFWLTREHVPTGWHPYLSAIAETLSVELQMGRGLGGPEDLVALGVLAGQAGRKGGW